MSISNHTSFREKCQLTGLAALVVFGLTTKANAYFTKKDIAYRSPEHIETLCANNRGAAIRETLKKGYDISCPG